MPDLLVDLRNQARSGAAFALRKQQGGTGRDDGMAAGFSFDATNRTADFGAAAISRGMVVERATAGDLGPAITIRATDAATDTPVGIALEDIALGATGTIVQMGAPIFVLTTGTIAVGNTLWTSATSGRATATQTVGAFVIGISLNDASGTSSVWAIVTLLGAANSDHGLLTGLTDDDHTQYVLETLLDAKGDIFAASAADTAARVPVGANNTVLTADSTQATGVRWAVSAAGSAAAIVKQLTNKSGGTVNKGDAVIVDETATDSFTTTTTKDTETSIGIVEEASIANDAVGAVTLAGYVDLSNTASISQSIGDYIYTSSNAKIVHGSNTRNPGAFGQFLRAGSNSSAWLWGAGDQTATGGGGGGSGIPSGTSFPGSPSNNDLFYRTDRDLLYFYDGTRWLTLNLYYDNMQDSGEFTMPSDGTGRVLKRWLPATQDYDIWLEAIHWWTFPATTNNGTNYHTVTVDKVDSASSATAVASIDTSADTVGARKRQKTTENELLGTGTYDVQATQTQTGNPGALYLQIMLAYRLVG